MRERNHLRRLKYFKVLFKYKESIYFKTGLLNINFYNDNGVSEYFIDKDLYFNPHLQLHAHNLQTNGITGEIEEKGLFFPHQSWPLKSARYFMVLILV